jgi:nicotinamide-nucleotide amidase
MDVAIVAVGSELTTGRVVDTNSAWISRRLMTAGLKPIYHVCVPDERPAVIQALREATSRAKGVVVSGGLGPTEDDLTRDAIAEAAQVPLEFHPPSLERIEAIYASFGRAMPVSNRRQAEFPRGARILDNDCGTAPGFSLDLWGARLWSMPGVPREMFRMWERWVEPELRAFAGISEGSIVERTLRTCGIAESALGERVCDLVPRGDPEAEIAYCVKDDEGTILLTFTVRNSRDPEAAARRADSLAREAAERLGRKVCVTGTATLPERVVSLLVERRRTLAVAESCTGGRVSAWITAVPGASACFREGVVVYANEAKVKHASVPEELIARHGAVSAEVARALAVGIRANAGTDYGLGITGIAGPTGATPEKPVGLVHLAFAGPPATPGGAPVVAHVERRFAGDRGRIQVQATAAAIDLLRLALEDEAR